MDTILFWIYFLNAILLISHEIDSAYWHEWNLFKLPGEITGFLIIHFPLIAFILLGLVLVYEQIWWGLICSLVLGGGGVFAFFIHTYFINKGRKEFRTPISLFILISMFFVSLLQIGITACLLIL